MNIGAQIRFRGRLTAAFCIFATLVFTGLLWGRRNEDPYEVLFSLLLVGVCLIPSWLWVRGRALGFPLYPLFGVSFIWSFAAPVIIGHPSLFLYGQEVVVRALLIAIVSFAASIPIWLKLVGRECSPPSSLFEIPTNRGVGIAFLCLFLVAGILYSFAAYGGWFAHGGALHFASPAFGVIRAMCISAATIACFILAYLQGVRALSKSAAFASIFLIVGFVLTNVAGLMLIGGANAAAIAYVGFILGRKRLAVFPVVVMIAVFSVLHLGKGEMRVKYGFPGSTFFLQPAEYPAFFSEWIGDGLSGEVIEVESGNEEEKPTVLSRASLIQHLIKAVYMTPDMVPYMNGETYMIVPAMFVPRLVWAGKPAGHESTTLLNIHFGNQTREDTLRTTIGWGMFNEAYANFGVVGTLAYSALMALLYGGAARWCMNCSVLSFRFMASISLTAFILKSEMPASIFVGSAVQMYIVLLAMMIVFMKQIDRGGQEKMAGPPIPGVAPRAA